MKDSIKPAKKSYVPVAQIEVKSQTSQATDRSKRTGQSSGQKMPSSAVTKSVKLNDSILSVVSNKSLKRQTLRQSPKPQKKDQTAVAWDAYVTKMFQVHEIALSEQRKSVKTALNQSANSVATDYLQETELPSATENMRSKTKNMQTEYYGRNNVTEIGMFMPNLTEMGRTDSDILFKMTERQVMDEVGESGRNNWSNLETPLYSYNEMPVKKGSAAKPGEIRHISSTVQKQKTSPDTPLDLNISFISQTAMQNQILAEKTKAARLDNLQRKYSPGRQRPGNEIQTQSKFKLPPQTQMGERSEYMYEENRTPRRITTPPKHIDFNTKRVNDNDIFQSKQNKNKTNSVLQPFTQPIKVMGLKSKQKLLSRPPSSKEGGQKTNNGKIASFLSSFHVKTSISGSVANRQSFNQDKRQSEAKKSEPQPGKLTKQSSYSSIQQTQGLTKTTKIQPQTEKKMQSQNNLNLYQEFSTKKGFQYLQRQPTPSSSQSQSERSDFGKKPTLDMYIQETKVDNDYQSAKSTELAEQKQTETLPSLDQGKFNKKYLMEVTESSQNLETHHSVKPDFNTPVLTLQKQQRRMERSQSQISNLMPSFRGVKTGQTRNEVDVYKTKNNKVSGNKRPATKSFISKKEEVKHAFNYSSHKREDETPKSSQQSNLTIEYVMRFLLREEELLVQMLDLATDGNFQELEMTQLPYTIEQLYGDLFIQSKICNQRPKVLAAQLNILLCTATNLVEVIVRNPPTMKKYASKIGEVFFTAHQTFLILIQLIIEDCIGTKHERQIEFKLLKHVVDQRVDKNKISLQAFRQANEQIRGNLRKIANDLIEFKGPELNTFGEFGQIMLESLRLSLDESQIDSVKNPNANDRMYEQLNKMQIQTQFAVSKLSLFQTKAPETGKALQERRTKSLLRNFKQPEIQTPVKQKLAAHLYQDNQNLKTFAPELVKNENDGNEEAEDELVETQYVPLMTKSIMVRDKCDKLETVEESSVNFDDSPDRDSSYYLIRDLPDFTETDQSPGKQSDVYKKALNELQNSDQVKELTQFKHLVKEQYSKLRLQEHDLQIKVTKTDLMKTEVEMLSPQVSDDTPKISILDKNSTTINYPDTGYLLPENIAFLIANAVQSSREQRPGEVTNINNNINFYGPVQVCSPIRIQADSSSQYSKNKKSLKKTLSNLPPLSPDKSKSKIQVLKPFSQQKMAIYSPTSPAKTGIGSGIRNIAKSFVQARETIQKPASKPSSKVQDFNEQFVQDSRRGSMKDPKLFYKRESPLDADTKSNKSTKSKKSFNKSKTIKKRPQTEKKGLVQNRLIKIDLEDEEEKPNFISPRAHIIPLKPEIQSSAGDNTGKSRFSMNPESKEVTKERDYQINVQSGCPYCLEELTVQTFAIQLQPVSKEAQPFELAATPIAQLVSPLSQQTVLTEFGTELTKYQRGVEYIPLSWEEVRPSAMCGSEKSFMGNKEESPFNHSESVKISIGTFQDHSPNLKDLTPNPRLLQTVSNDSSGRGEKSEVPTTMLEKMLQRQQKTIATMNSMLLLNDESEDIKKEMLRQQHLENLQRRQSKVSLSLYKTKHQHRTSSKVWTNTGQWTNNTEIQRFENMEGYNLRQLSQVDDSPSRFFDQSKDEWFQSLVKRKTIDPKTARSQTIAEQIKNGEQALKLQKEEEVEYEFFSNNQQKTEQVNLLENDSPGKVLEIKKEDSAIKPYISPKKTKSVQKDQQRNGSSEKFEIDSDEESRPRIAVTTQFAGGFQTMSNYSQTQNTQHEDEEFPGSKPVLLHISPDTSPNNFQEDARLCFKNIQNYIQDQSNKLCYDMPECELNEDQLLQIELNRLRESVTVPFLPPFSDEMADDEFLTYTLVLDLDETLIHYDETDNECAFYIRPGAQDFLRELSFCYEIVVFTAAMPDYADRILDILDPQGRMIKHRLYRQHTTPKDDFAIKDLHMLGRPLERTIIVDNLRENFHETTPNNGIWVESWYSDMADRVLPRLQQFLIQIVEHEIEDVRVLLTDQIKEDIIYQCLERNKPIPHINDLLK